MTTIKYSIPIFIDILQLFCKLLDNHSVHMQTYTLSYSRKVRKRTLKTILKINILYSLCIIT